MAGTQVSYTQLAIAAVVSAVMFDLLIAKTHLLARKLFWTSYAIVISFQLLTNWWLTSRNIVMYDPAVITGVRIASAPIEDLLFGFSMILLSISAWEFFKKRLNSK